MQLTGAQIIAQCLLEQQVDVIFGYPGGTILPTYDALYEVRDKILHVLTSHEQGASHAADGYARATGKVGVCIATSGPGATNLVTGIATAYMDSIPMVVITGNVPLLQIGTDSFQEVDTTGITMPITKHNALVRNVNDLAPTIREAFRLAKEGRHGPVLVDVPKDVQNALGEYEAPAPAPAVDANAAFAQALATFEQENYAALERAAEMIDKSQRPMILVGGGVIRSGASEAFATFAHRTGAPVATTLMGLGAFPSSDPQFVGNIGMHGSFEANTGSAMCDLFIAVGARFSDRITGNPYAFLPDAKVLHIDVDRSEIGKNVFAHRKLVGDARVVLTLLEKRLGSTDRTDWMKQIDILRQQGLDAQPAPEPGSIPPADVMHSIRRVVGEDALVTTDVGQHQMWTAVHMPFEKPDTLLTSGGMGTMGYGMGAAMGAQFGQPDNKVVLITGDGCFRMNCNELSTLAFYNLPVVIVLMNNTVLGMVRQWQTLFYQNHYSQTTLDRGPDFVKLAESYGVGAKRIEKPEDFEPAFAAAVAARRPYLLEVMIGKDEMVRPMVGPGQPVTNFLLL